MDLSKNFLLTIKYYKEILQGYIVSNIRKGIRSKYFPNFECNCNYTTKVKGTCY